MLPTLVYLTRRQSDELSAVSRVTGRTESELIREAVDRLIDRSAAKRRDAVLRQAAGLWKDRDDLPDFRNLRTSWDR